MGAGFRQSEDLIERGSGAARGPGPAQAEGHTDAHRAGDGVALKVPVESPPGCVDTGDPLGGRGFRVGRQLINDRIRDCGGCRWGVWFGFRFGCCGGGGRLGCRGWGVGFGFRGLVGVRGFGFSGFGGFVGLVWVRWFWFGCCGRGWFGCCGSGGGFGFWVGCRRGGGWLGFGRCGGGCGLWSLGGFGVSDRFRRGRCVRGSTGRGDRAQQYQACEQLRHAISTLHQRCRFPEMSTTAVVGLGHLAAGGAHRISSVSRPAAVATTKT